MSKTVGVYARLADGNSEYVRACEGNDVAEYVKVLDKARVPSDTPYMDATRLTVMADGKTLYGKIVSEWRKTGLFYVKESETGERFFGYKDETDAKIKSGKGVVFEAGDYEAIRGGDGKVKYRHAVNVRNNPRPEEVENEALRKAVTEYFESQGSRRVHLYGVAVNKKSGYKMLVVHHIDEGNRRLTSLAEYQGWADGHWDVTEAHWTVRENEERMVKAFVESQDYV